MEGILFRMYHVAELGKSLLPEPLVGAGGQCVFILCSGEFLGGLLELLNLVKMLNILNNLTLSTVRL